MTLQQVMRELCKEELRRLLESLAVELGIPPAEITEMLEEAMELHGPGLDAATERLSSGAVLH